MVLGQLHAQLVCCLAQHAWSRPPRRSAELANIKLRRSEKKARQPVASLQSPAPLLLLVHVPYKSRPCAKAPCNHAPRPQVLNEVNHSDRVRYPIMGAKPGKVLERITSAAHKIHILVSKGCCECRSWRDGGRQLQFHGTHTYCCRMPLLPCRACLQLRPASNCPAPAAAQVNEGLSDVPTDKLDYSLKQDVEQVLGAVLLARRCGWCPPDFRTSHFPPVCNAIHAGGERGQAHCRRHGQVL